MMIHVRLALLSLLVAGCSTAEVRGPADLIVHHAKVITVDARFSIAEAVAIKDGRIVAIGDDEEIFKWSGPGTKVIDADGHPVLPGLIDSHVHITSAAR